MGISFYALVLLPALCAVLGHFKKNEAEKQLADGKISVSKEVHLARSKTKVWFNLALPLH